MMNKWDNYFSKLCDLTAELSYDTTKVGCVIVGKNWQVVSAGFNGLPRFVNDNVPERMVSPEKYYWMAHAELNAICNASLSGASCLKCTLYVNHYPCSDCAKAIIQSGISYVVVTKNKELSDSWKKHKEVAETMFKEACVSVRFLEMEDSVNDRCTH